MLTNLNEVVKLIEAGNWLHLSGNEDLLKKLPRGNWIGGSTEYFMDKTGGAVTNEKLFVQEIPYTACKIAAYNEKTIQNITEDAYPNGFSIIILPFDSEVHKTYAKNAAGFKEIFLKNIIGWVSGTNLSVPGQTPITVNGQTGEVSSCKAVVLHVSLPDDKLANIGIINIFTQNENSPMIEFSENSFTVQKCLVNGQEVVFSEYLAKNNIDTKLPIIGEYSGTGVNVSVKQIDGNTVSLYAPVFEGIKYRFANPITDYASAFKTQLEGISENPVFTCNCILNFLYGELEGKQIQSLFGPITFGEVAYQLVNQTLVYLSVY
ncbi:MAG: hypothetical protein WCP73_02350 [Eubacteriales bacterium]